MHYPDKIERHLQHVAPKHVEGYRKGWLDIKYTENAIHIYSAGKIVTTILRGSGG